jgi:hypothetical protein
MRRPTRQHDRPKNIRAGRQIKCIDDRLCPYRVGSFGVHLIESVENLDSQPSFINALALVRLTPWTVAIWSTIHASR